MGRLAAAEVHDRRPAVIAAHSVEPQPVEQVRVVAEAEERLGVGADQLRVEVAQHGDLVAAADGGQHGADGRVGEGGVQVGRSLGRRALAARRRVLDRLHADLLAQPAQAQLVHLGRDARARERRRHDGDAITRRQLRRRGNSMPPLDQGAPAQMPTAPRREPFSRRAEIACRDDRRQPTRLPGPRQWLGCWPDPPPHPSGATAAGDPGRARSPARRHRHGRQRAVGARAGPVPHRGAPGRRGEPDGRPARRDRARHLDDLGLRVLDRELAPLAGGGALPHGLQQGRHPPPPRRARPRWGSASAGPDAGRGCGAA